jgi:hypothetical protein
MLTNHPLRRAAQHIRKDVTLHIAHICHSARSLTVVSMIAALFAACSRPQNRGEHCRVVYPLPENAQSAADAIPIPALETLPLYHPSDSLPQIYNADSSAGWYRNVFLARFGSFRSQEEVHSFMLRFQARVVGRTEADGWYAVTIPDPGPDTTTFSILSFCIGADFGVYVRSVPAGKLPLLFADTATDVQSN